MESCNHVWKEENREWYEGHNASNRVVATVRICERCSKEEIVQGQIYFPEGGVYELLSPDGSIGGALCAAGW